MTHEVRGLAGPTIVFSYVEVDVSGLEAESLLASGHPAQCALVPLARGGTEERVERAVRTIEATSASEEGRVTLGTAMWVCATVAGNHGVLERITTMFKLRDIPAIRELIDEERAKAEGKAWRTALRARLQRLGPVSRPLLRKLDAVTDPAELERLVEVALDATSVAGFEKAAFPSRRGGGPRRRSRPPR